MGKYTTDQLIKAIYGQESGEGRADTSKPNYAGAIGPMQVIRKTFDGLKASGSIPPDADFNNPEHTKAAGEVLVRQLSDRYKGDPKKVFAAYYAGEKAVRPDGSISNFKDKLNPQAPTTHQYVDQVYRRLGAEQEGGEEGVTPVAAEPVGLAPADLRPSLNMGTPLPGKIVPAVGLGGQYSEPPIKAPYLPVFPLPNEAVISPADAALSDSTLNKATTKLAEDTSFRDKMKAAVIQTDIIGAVIRRRALHDFSLGHSPVPGYQVPAEDLVGMTEDEQAFMRQSPNPQIAAWTKLDIDRTREDMATLNRSGVATSVAATLVAGLPTGVLSGLGAMKAFSLAKVGAATMTTTAGKLTSSLAENAVGNIGLLAAQSGVDPYVGMHDVPMALGMSLIGTGVYGATLATKVATAAIPGKVSAQAEPAAPVYFDPKEAATLGQALQDGAAKEALSLYATVAKGLPEGSTPSQFDLAKASQGDITRYVNELTAPPTKLVLPAKTLTDDMADVVVQNQPDTPAIPGLDTKELGPPGKFHESRDIEAQDWHFRNTPGGAQQLATIEGITAQAADALPMGVHVRPGLATNSAYKDVVGAFKELAARFLPDDTRVVLGHADMPTGAHGVTFTTKSTSFVGIHPDMPPQQAINVATHELAHVLSARVSSSVPPPIWAGVIRDFEAFRKDAIAGQPGVRFQRFHEGSKSASTEPLLGGKNSTAYILDVEEYIAEGFVRHVGARIRAGDAVVSQEAIGLFKAAWDKVKALWAYARSKGWVKADEGLHDFFRWAETQKAAGAVPTNGTPGGKVGGEYSKDVEAALVGQEALRKRAQELRIDMPSQTPSQLKRLQAVVQIHEAANAANVVVDESRLSAVLNTSVFRGAQSLANTMLRSKNPVLRWASATILENPSGAGGRRATPAMSKYLDEGKMLGKSDAIITTSYADFRRDMGGSIWEDFNRGRIRDKFNEEVYKHIEDVRNGSLNPPPHPSIVQAAEALAGVYQRALDLQKAVGTAGAEFLPDTSKGYLPHQMDGAKLLALTPEQEMGLHKSISQQYQATMGYDAAFADQLTSKYLGAVRNNALGGFSAPIGLRTEAAFKQVEAALMDMGLPEAELAARLAKLGERKQGGHHTQKRADFDIFAPVVLADGSTFRMYDVMQNDVLALTKSHVESVAGQTALTAHGIPDLALIRDAAMHPGVGERPTKYEIEGLDQLSAEMLHTPFGSQNKLVSRLLSANALVRLGGMAWNQLSETVNGVWHVGVANTLHAAFDAPRLLRELRDLRAGKDVPNPLLSNIELTGGREFGMDNLRTVFPFESQQLDNGVYGTHTDVMIDRLLKGGLQAQAKLGFWRALHATQNRGFAESIVRNVMEVAHKGDSHTLSPLMAEMGFKPEVVAAIRAELSNIATFDSNGRVLTVDITKMQDTQAAKEFVQSVYRGVTQIIQEPRVGERGRWSHDPVMRAVTQFKTFGFLSVEKQWLRGVGTVGTAKALGMLVGAVSLAAPIYTARVYASSIGRSDQEKFLKERLTTQNVVRASLSYVSMAGLSGELIYHLSNISGVGLSTSESRGGANRPFVGSAILPAAGLLNDLSSAYSFRADGTGSMDWHKPLLTLPFNRIPWVIPAVNALKPD